MHDARLRELWGQLQGRKPVLPHFLLEIQLSGLRGIDGLRVAFDCPVSVIVGENGSGKSTLLRAAACAYRVPGAGAKDFLPSSLFADHGPGIGAREDRRDVATIDFEYVTPEGRRSMRWRRSGGWKRSFFGRRNARQPERPVLLRTRSDLGAPGMSRFGGALAEKPFPASQLEFAHRSLPFRYAEVLDLSGTGKSLLYASRPGGTSYSELHMSAGERAVFRLGQEIVRLKCALVLIDEVEAGLHPQVQTRLLIQLQQLAIRNDLQVVLTTHSPVVLDCVPPHGRIFLERDEPGRVAARTACRDFVLHAHYGRSAETLNVLCEGDAAEGVLRGAFDVLLPRHRIRSESVRIGRGAGADEFASHASRLAKFGLIDRFAFVLDGDKRGSAAERRLREGSDAVLFLPGGAPEVWLWDTLRRLSVEEATEAGLGGGELRTSTGQLDDLYAPATDAPAEIARTKLRGLAEALGLPVSDVARAVGRVRTGQPGSDLQPLAEALGKRLLRRRG